MNLSLVIPRLSDLSIKEAGHKNPWASMQFQERHKLIELECDNRVAYLPDNTNSLQWAKNALMGGDLSRGRHTW